jgi:hypothetical protein
VAQLQIAQLLTRYPSDIQDRLSRISTMLDRADAHLGRSPPTKSSTGPAEALLESDRFDDQRARIPILRALIAQIQPQS